MEQRRPRLRRARPHRRHHRARQLHRPARRHRGGARHRARRRQAGGRPDHARRFCRTVHRRRRYAAGGGGDRCAPRSRLSASVRPGRPHARGAAACAACAKRCARRRPARRGIIGTAADLLAAAWPAGERAAERGRAARGPRHRLGGAAWRRRERKRRGRPSRSTCARPTRSRRTPRGCRADDRLRQPPVRARRAGALGSERAATPPPSPRLHAASFRRGWSEQEVETLLLDRHVIAHRADHRRQACTASSCRGWLARRGRNSLGRGRARAAAGAGLRGRCSTLHLRRLAGLGARAVFLEVDEHNAAGDHGSTTAPVFAKSPAGPTIIRAGRRQARGGTGAAPRSGLIVSAAWTHDGCRLNIDMAAVAWHGRETTLGSRRTGT